MRLVREIVFIMNACDFFYDPSISVLQMFKNACECCCESCECAANETGMQSMGTVSSLHNTHSRIISAWSCLIILFPSNLD